MQGYVQLDDNSDGAVSGIQDAVKKALMVIGLKSERYAKDNCTRMRAVDTGLLRNSITFALSGGYAQASGYTADRGKNGRPPETGTYSGKKADGSDEEPAVYIGTNVRYAQIIEFGSRKIAPRPFLHDAAADHADEYRQIFEDALKNG